MTIFLILMQTLLRPLLGGFFNGHVDGGVAYDSIIAKTLGRIPTAAIYVLILLSAYFLVGGPWTANIFAGISVLSVYRIYGHSFMRSYPPTSSRSDMIRIIADDVAPFSPFKQWVIYAFIRYTLLIWVLSYALKELFFANVDVWMLSSVVIPLSYYISVRYFKKFKHFDSNYFAEFASGLMMGLSLYAMY